MSTQTEALRLAEYLDLGTLQFNSEAAAELRRLHAANAELAEALELCFEHCRLWHPYVDKNNVGAAVRAALSRHKEQA